VEFEWDENKERKNIEKHGIDFDQAKGIWSGPILEVAGSGRSGEERFIAIGTYEQICFAVVYTRRGGRIRIISARRARREERSHYQRQIG
jgi:uncharacterized DUF497 family protein